MNNSEANIEAVESVYNVLTCELNHDIYRGSTPSSYKIVVGVFNPRSIHHIKIALNVVIPGPIKTQEQGHIRFANSPNYRRVAVFNISHETLITAIKRCEQLLEEHPDQWDELVSEFILRG